MSRRVLATGTRIRGTDKRVVDFWQRAYSDIAQNITRGPFTEYLVATALRVNTKSTPRDTWAEADIVWRKFRIEVKSTASFQAWKPRSGRKRKEATGLSVGFAKIAYTLDGGRRRARRSHVYVLAFDDAPNRARLRDLDATRWRFWVLDRREFTTLMGVPMGRLVGHSKSLPFKRLEDNHFNSVGFEQLGSAIRVKCR